MIKPLEGIRIVSMAEQYPGPYATMLMADLGADVTLVERPGDGDPTRMEWPFFEALNRNKRSVSLDLKTADGRAQLMRLVDGCDIFLEGFRPGTAARLGVGYADLAGRNNRLIYLSISAFGQTGPYRERPAHDLSIQAICGLLAGREASAIASPYVANGDLVSGLFAAFAAVSALQLRASTGVGTYVDVSMADCLVSWMTVILGPLLNGTQPLEPRQPGYGTYRCLDGLWLTLSVLQEEHLWQALATAIGRPDLSVIDTAGRNRRYDELREAVATQIRSRPRGEWAELLDRYGVAWAPVLEPQEVLSDPHFDAREMFVALDGSKGLRNFVAQPLKFQGLRLLPQRHAPSLGEHNDGLP